MYSLTLLTLFALFTSSASSVNGAITLPLSSKRTQPPFQAGYLSPSELADLDYTTDLDAIESSRLDVIYKFAQARGDVVKRRLDLYMKERKRKRTVSTVPLTNHNFDTSYSAKLDLGTPPTAFDVLMDTGSSDTWVTQSNCTCTSSGCTACSAGSSWNPSSSSTFSQRGKVLSIQYGSGIVTGSTGMDVASLGGFTISNQVIGLVDKAAKVLPGNVEGIMGLAFGSIARAGGTPWWLRVVQGDASDSGGTVDSPLMSFWLSRYVDSSSPNSNNPGGQFIIGGTNSSLYSGDITYFDVVQPAEWWLIKLASVGIQGGGDPVSVVDGASQAIIDTGSTLVGGEDTVVNSVLSGVSGAVQGSTIETRLSGFWALPCNTSTVVTLTFGSTTYSYSTADLLYQRIDDLLPNYCLSSLFVYSSADPHSIDYTPNGTPYWLVGAAFLKNVYSVFSLGSGGSGSAGIQGMGNNGATAQVGFATLSGTNGEIGFAGDDADGPGGTGNTPANASGNGTQVTSATATSAGASGTASVTASASGGPHGGGGVNVTIPGIIPDVTVDTTVVVVTATGSNTPQSTSGAERMTTTYGVGVVMGALVLTTVFAL